MVAIQQYIDDWNVDIKVITETHIQESGYDKISLKGMTRASTSCREQGRNKGGVAIYVSDKIPCVEETSTVTREKMKLNTAQLSSIPTIMHRAD